MRPLLTVLDTCAGPNLIRADLLTPEVLASSDTKRPMANLASASNHHLDTMSIVKLTVEIASYAVLQPFVVVRQLGADSILACTYIDTHVEQVRPRMMFIQLANGVRVPIRRHAQAILLDRPTKESQRVTPAPVLTQSTKVRVARRTRVPAGTVVAIQVSAPVSGPHVLSPVSNLHVR